MRTGYAWLSSCAGCVMGYEIHGLGQKPHKELDPERELGRAYLVFCIQAVIIAKHETADI